MSVLEKVRTYRLDEIAEISSGVTLGRKLDHAELVELPYLRVANVQDGHLDLTDVKTVSVRPSEVERFRLRPGDLVMTEGGDKDKLGRGTLWTGELPMCLHQNHIFRVRVKPELVIPKFLAWFIRSQQARAYFLRSAKQTTNLATINSTQLKALPVALPPVDEQRRIAAILDQADALRDKRRQALAQVEQLTQSVYLEMFGDGSEWISLGLEEFCATSADIKCGPFGTQLLREEFTTSGVPLWGIKQVNAGFKTETHEFLTKRKAEELAAYSILPGDIVMTRKGTVGNCAVYPDSYPPGVMHSDLLRVRVDCKRFSPPFVSAQLHFSPQVERQIRLISGGAIMPGINVGKLKGITLAAPPLELQQDFARRVEGIERLKAAHRRSLEEMDALFASLQHRAFRGEL